MDKKNKYWQLFLSTFKLSACTFGGGFVIIPLMRERFVKELHWIDEEEMLDLTAIAQSSPGSIAINASILVGYHVAGIPGALITVVGAALPPLIIISIISVFYQAFRSNKYVSMAMAGMLAGVAAVIFDVVINMMWPILKKKRWLPITVMLAAFVATRFFSVNIILIILVLAGSSSTATGCDREYHDTSQHEGYHSLFHFAFLHKCKLCVKTIITFYQLNIYYRFRFCAFLWNTTYFYCIQKNKSFMDGFYYIYGRYLFFIHTHSDC